MMHKKDERIKFFQIWFNNSNETAPLWRLLSSCYPFNGASVIIGVVFKVKDVSLNEIPSVFEISKSTINNIIFILKF
jgi:hypothetical protein